MTDKSSIEDVRRVVSEFEDSRTRPDSAFNQFTSAARDVYPEEFDGSVHIREYYLILREIKDIIKIRTRFQLIGMVSIIIGVSSGINSFGSGWIEWLQQSQLILSIIEYILLALGLTSIGYAEFGLKRDMMTKIQHMELITKENLTNRTLYFGSAQYSIRLGDDGIHYYSNRLSVFLQYWSVDISEFIKKNGLPKIDVAPFRDIPLRDVKSGRAEGEQFEKFFHSIRAWYRTDINRKSILIPLMTHKTFLNRSIRDADLIKNKTPSKALVETNEATRLLSETLIIPIAPFNTNRDSDINPIEFAICLYFAISRAHLDRINTRRKADEKA